MSHVAVGEVASGLTLSQSRKGLPGAFDCRLVLELSSLDLLVVYDIVEAIEC